MKRLLWLAALLCLAALALDYKTLKPDGYVTDYAGRLDQESHLALERYCRHVQDTTGAQVAIVLLKSLEGEPPEDFANNLFRHWGIGRKEEDDGILILLAVNDRISRMEVGHGLEPYLPDAYAGHVLDALRPLLRQNRYGEALMLAVEDIGARIAAGKGIKTEGAPRRRRSHPVPLPIVLFLGGLGVMVLLSFLSGARRRYRPYQQGGNMGSVLPAILLGNLMGRHQDWGRGGGGFGGFDSGDSFGGFGGGDSGGGGATSSW